MARAHQSVVPLRAGAGPDNPPCPACGEPLFGWIDARPRLRLPVSRCENCGLGVVGAPAAAEEALEELDRAATDGGIRVLNRAGFAAWLGGAGWSGLQRGPRFLFTVEAVRRLVARRDQVVVGCRWLPWAGIATMWQTLLNSATFGHNLIVGVPSPAARGWQRRIDWLTVVVLAVPALVVAMLVEPLGAALRRGGAVRVAIQPGPGAG